MIPPFMHDWQTGIRRGGQMNLKIMTENLLDVKEIFDKYEIPFVLIGGGLLGLIREGQFLLHDHDLDIACFNEEVRHDPCKMRWVKDDLEKKGFYIVDSSRCRCKTDFFIRGGERIDIFWFDKIDNEYIFNNEVRWPVDFFDYSEPIKFGETTIFVPCKPEEFLEYTYGKDWKTPIPNAHILNLNPREIEKRKNNV